MPDLLAGWPGSWAPTSPDRPVDARQAVRPEPREADRVGGDVPADDVTERVVDVGYVGAQEREDVR